METFEKLGEFKKAVKNLVRAAVKAGVFADDGDFVFDVTKTEDSDTKTIAVTITNGFYTAAVSGEACTRVFNKVEAELFAPIVTQFEKLKKVKSIKFNL